MKAVRIYNRALTADEVVQNAVADEARFSSGIEHGLYITTDLYVSRAHVVSWRELGIDRDGAVKQDAYKILVAFWEPAFTTGFLSFTARTGYTLDTATYLCEIER